jgi:hypothetical protein
MIPTYYSMWTCWLSKNTRIPNERFWSLSATCSIGVRRSSARKSVSVVSYCHTVILSYSHTVILSYCQNVTDRQFVLTNIKYFIWSFFCREKVMTCLYKHRREAEELAPSHSHTGARRRWVVSTELRPIYPSERSGVYRAGGWVGLGVGLDIAENLAASGILSPSLPVRG